MCWPTVSIQKGHSHKLHLFGIYQVCFKHTLSQEMYEEGRVRIIRSNLRMGNWGSERNSDLPKFKDLVTTYILMPCFPIQIQSSFYHAISVNIAMNSSTFDTQYTVLFHVTSCMSPNLWLGKEGLVTISWGFSWTLLFLSIVLTVWQSWVRNAKGLFLHWGSASRLT